MPAPHMACRGDKDDEQLAVGCVSGRQGGFSCVCVYVWQQVRIGVKKLRQADRALDHILFLQVNKLGNVMIESGMPLACRALWCVVCFCRVSFIFDDPYFIISLCDMCDKNNLFLAFLIIH